MRRQTAKTAGGKWNQSKKTWDFPFDPTVVEVLVGAFPDIELPSDFAEKISKRREDAEITEKLK